MYKIYIDDNLSFLKKNLETLKNKIDIIYIDPPYNTKAQKSYQDNMKSLDWLNEIKQRLDISYKYLSNQGVIFISIDDNEMARLKLLCDTIYGEKNFLGTLITKQAQRSNAKFINTVHEYILVYAKNKKYTQEFSVKRIEIPNEKLVIQSLQKKIRLEFNKNGKESAFKLLKKSIEGIVNKYNFTWINNYSYVDDQGKIFFPKDLSTPSKPSPLNIPKINLHLPPLATRGWSSEEKFIKLHSLQRLYFRNGRPYEIHYLEESVENVPSIINFYSRQGTNDLNKLGLRDLFDTPKPVDLIKFLIRIINNRKAIVLDFYAGSGTTGQAVLELNENENFNLSFILVQKNEELRKDSISYLVANENKIKPTVSEALIKRINVVFEKLKIEKTSLEVYL